ncbi:MAG TPA: isoleucine--tRNA ligase [Longimicrobiales bacterium]|nr:isoleucine--tRNA ligase [Longimicrobiales bacterium]
MSYPDFPPSLTTLEEEVLERWRETGLFRQVQDATAQGEPFVFYEGPPTANGRPGLHHIISRTIKDLVCRFRTMQGRQVTRIAGWDTHGLPVEIEAERKLGISGKPDIEALGIEKFNEACRESVFTYKEEWEELSERIGYWLDYSRPYVTFHNDYVESVWAILKELSDRGLLYRGHKSVPYCPRCGTALSSHEVAQGYRDVEDPSLYFLAPLLGSDGTPDGRHLLVWTTTPWTVPSNVGMAVHPDLAYAEVEVQGRRYVLARDRVAAVLGEDAAVVREFSGSELVGRRYGRPVEMVREPEEPGNAWTVVAEDFVSADDGTGIVHMAPAFGADDYAAGQRHDLPMLRPIDDAGVFLPDVGVVGGRFVKDADPLVVEDLRARGLLFRAGTEVHSYPHCWRCSSPLIYLARDSWFAATSSLKDEMLANNDQVAWHPPEVGEKRFAEWLRGNVDWALSRDRYWGTPLPVWVCDRDPSHLTWIGSFAELAEHAGALPADFDPHRPFIDEHAWGCRCGGTMRRDPAVIDVWFDSGSMPYAQWHYPFENRDEFQAHFPADFICEGLDQTRGWFYSLMAVGTMLGRGPVYRNVVVNDLILDAEGQKMSKSKGNSVDPWDAIADHGADGMRWYFIHHSNPWVPKRFDPEGVREAARKYFDTLANTYRFFALYANTEGWTPGDVDPAPGDRPVLDRWLLSRLATVSAEVTEELENYQVTRAYRALSEFVDELSNWYVRRSRARFWGNGDRDDANAAFRTLYDALRTVAVLSAPVTPFVSDWLHGALTGGSVHLERFPGVSTGERDAALEEEMDAARRLVSLGRAAREEVGIRVRQPLRTLHAVVPGGSLREEVLELVRDELNVKGVAFLSSAAGLVTLTARPNYRALGPRFGKSTNDAANALRALPQDALERFRSGAEVTFELEGTVYPIQEGELELLEEAQGDLVVKSELGHTAALDPALDDDLREEGLARELVNRIQRLRKDSGLEITDRIVLGIFGPAEVQAAARRWADFIAGETLAVEASVAEAGSAGEWEAYRDTDLDGVAAVVALSRAGS